MVTIKEFLYIYYRQDQHVPTSLSFNHKIGLHKVIYYTTFALPRRLTVSIAVPQFFWSLGYLDKDEPARFSLVELLGLSSLPWTV